MKQILPYVLILIVGLIGGHLVTPSVIDAHKALLDKEKQLWDHRLDSMAIVQRVSLIRDSIWTRISRQDRDSLEIERIHHKLMTNAAKIWQDKYNKLHNSPVARYNEHQLDSVVSVLLLESRKHR